MELPMASPYAARIQGLVLDGIADARERGIRDARGQFLSLAAETLHALQEHARVASERLTKARAVVEQDDAESTPDLAAKHVQELREARHHAVHYAGAAAGAKAVLEAIRRLNVKPGEDEKNKGVACPKCPSWGRPDTDDCKHFVCVTCGHPFTPEHNEKSTGGAS
jgi:hypothetical protein